MNTYFFDFERKSIFKNFTIIYVL